MDDNFSEGKSVSPSSGFLGNFPRDNFTKGKFPWNWFEIYHLPRNSIKSTLSQLQSSVIEQYHVNIYKYKLKYPVDQEIDFFKVAHFLG